MIPSGFQRVERPHVDVCNAAGQGLSGLPQEVERSGAKDQKFPRAHALPPVVVDDASQLEEEPRCAVDLVEDHQTFGVGSQEAAGILQFGAVGR